MLKQYKKIKDKIVTINWSIPWKQEEDILNELINKREKYPDNPIYNSYFQHKAQMSSVGFLDKIMISVISFIGFFYLIFKYLFKKKNIC